MCFSFKELHALRHLRHSQRKKLSLQDKPALKREAGALLSRPGAPSKPEPPLSLPTNPGPLRAAHCFLVGTMVETIFSKKLFCHKAPIHRLSHMTGPEAASTTAGNGCQQARCCHTLASGSWNSMHVLRLAGDSDPSFRRRQKQGRKERGEGGRPVKRSLGNSPTVDFELTKVSMENCSRSCNDWER